MNADENTADRRLIEAAFPLKQASLDSVHEKNVRHGHISTLHIWPARRPLAASRAALLATLLPDPGTPEARKELIERIGGKVVKKIERKKVRGVTVETEKEETVGGILHWGRQSSPDLDWFREKIREAYGGRAPRVMDPFAGGGAIPLEAMRLGCEVTAIDINPVAWFILKCTLEYPQKLAGQKRPLPKFAMELPAFRTAWEEAHGQGTKKTSKQKSGTIEMFESPTPEADLAWHVRAWGHWVLARAREELKQYYPTVGGKPTVAYLWARTVRCKGCGATIPLLKTRWLCKKDDKRVLLTMMPRGDKSGVDFGVEYIGAASVHDRKVGAGTMSRSGAQCPCCPVIMTSEDIRFEGQAGRLGVIMTAVVTDGPDGKEYRKPTVEEISAAEKASIELDRVFSGVPFGKPDEAVPKGASRKGGGSAFTVFLYGLDTWSKLFTPRQLVSIGTIVKLTRSVPSEIVNEPDIWREAISALLVMGLDRLIDRSSALCQPDPTPAQSGVIHTFHRFALPMNWDFIEGAPLQESSGGYIPCLEWVAKVVEHTSQLRDLPTAKVNMESAISQGQQRVDIIVTDPPYYDAIPYSDLMDFFYIWMRRALFGISPEIDLAFSSALGPKWNSSKNDGELIDDAGRFSGNKEASKRNYEEGMARAFRTCRNSLLDNGRLVIVFAHKQPDAWETLVSAIIQAGFVVDASWPIQTEMGNRTRALAAAALSSSVWLVCKKRPETARPGWDNRVLEEMRSRIHERLRDFWDADIRGPDFVWAATGPAMEAYSKHPVVKKANEPGQVMAVSEFLRHVRRIVVDFVVGRVLTATGGTEAVSSLDDLTTYYLLHRHDFGLEEAPAGACILYAVSCGLSDRDLVDSYDLLLRSGSKSATDEVEDTAESEEEDAEESGSGSGSKLKLKAWEHRRRKGMGLDAEGRPAPLIDQVHKLMHLWRAQDVTKVNEYLEARALAQNALFHQLLQALIELAKAGSEERSLLEKISNHIGATKQASSRSQLGLALN